MKRLYPIYIILLVLGTVSYPAGGQDTVRQSTGYPDLDLYHLQAERNTANATTERRRYLMKTIPVDSIIMTYIEARDTPRDTVSLYHFFHYAHTILTQEEQRALLEDIYAYAHKYKSARLELLADYFNAQLQDNHDDYDHKMEMFEEVIRKARKAGDAEMESIVLGRMWFDNFYSQRYARSSAYARRLSEVLEKVDDDCPEKVWNNFWIGKAYYEFKDYDRALPYLRKAQFVEGWNYLAAYHKMNGNLDSAIYYYRKILTSREGREDHPVVQSAIAISELGRIELEQGNTDAAVAMLETGLDYMENHWADDISFISGLHISLGEAYLEKDDMAAALERITTARNLIGKLLETGVEIEYQKRIKALYALESGYYAQQGHHDLAKSYQDSALMATTRYEQLSGQHIILLGEQQLQEAEAQLRNRQVARQKDIILLTITALILVFATLLVIIRLYRRRNAAYTILAQKAQEWAMQEEMTRLPVSTSPQNVQAPESKAIFPKTDNGTNGKAKGNPTTEDLRIMALAEREMTENYAYREAGLTAESLADLLGVHRNMLARAVSRTTGGNFSLYINGFRIKEAIRIISQTSRRELYIEELSERVGFGNRNTFSRVFKQYTGLSPLEFQKQQANNCQIGEFQHFIK